MKFDKLATTAMLADKSLLIEQLESDFGEGKLTAKGKIDFQSQLTHYQTEFKLAKASTEKISKLIYGESTQKEFTGTLSLEGNMNASGSSGDALKKSASGSIKIHSKKGMLRQFSWLSKVFSILNVSQLFKFRLPDMVSEGMPYNDLKATFIIKNGVISSDDLFLESNAMNMSLVGRHDFVRDNMDLTVGIQPLQTVDKVVSHIPIVGWILTGENKATVLHVLRDQREIIRPQGFCNSHHISGQGCFGNIQTSISVAGKTIYQYRRSNPRELTLLSFLLDI